MTPSVPAGGERRAAPPEATGRSSVSTNGGCSELAGWAESPAGIRSAELGERGAQAGAGAAPPRPDRRRADVLLGGQRHRVHGSERLEERVPALGRQRGEARLNDTRQLMVLGVPVRRD